jgi:hypothetical protein
MGARLEGSATPTSFPSFEARKGALLRMTVANWYHHLFKKFSGRPGRAQSIAMSSPLPDSVM